MSHLVGCLYYIYQWSTVKQISDNEIYLLIKYIKSVLWRVTKRLSYTEDARCLKVNNPSLAVLYITPIKKFMYHYATNFLCKLARVDVPTSVTEFWATHEESTVENTTVQYNEKKILILLKLKKTSSQADIYNLEEK